MARLDLFEPRMTRRRTGIGNRLQRALHWEVIAVLPGGVSPGKCGHHHATASQAVACPWAPPGWDEMPICDLLVREIRTES